MEETGRKEEAAVRPLLLIFNNKMDRDRLLDRAPRLSKNSEEGVRNINIVLHLIMSPRKMEQEMFRKAEQHKLSRNSDEVSKNLVSKVLGRRGERVLRVVEMRQEENINKQGRVVRKGMEGGRWGTRQYFGRDQPTAVRGQTSKRQCSPGSSQIARRGWSGERRSGGRANSSSPPSRTGGFTFSPAKTPRQEMEGLEGRVTE